MGKRRIPVSVSRWSDVSWVIPANISQDSRSKFEKEFVKLLCKFSPASAEVRIGDIVVDEYGGIHEVLPCSRIYVAYDQPFGRGAEPGVTLYLDKVMGPFGCRNDESEGDMIVFKLATVQDVENDLKSMKEDDFYGDRKCLKTYERWLRAVKKRNKS